MAKIKIQKITNGHFCTAAEFAADFIESREGGSYYRFPEVSECIEETKARLNEMISEKSEYLTRMKIFISCELLTAHHSEGSNRVLPSVRPYYDNGRLACYYALPTIPLQFAEVESEVEVVIERQRKICARYDATEIEI